MCASFVYLYGVVPRSQDGPYCADGVQGLPVHLFPWGDLSAAISWVDSDEISDAPAHRRVMQRLLRHGAVLPAPEPTILPDPRALTELLMRNQRPMLAQLGDLSGLIEVRLQVERVGGAGGPRDPGSLAELEDERQYLWARFVAPLRSGGFSVSRLPLRHRRELLRLACLLPRSCLACFTLTCEALGTRLEGACRMDISPPMPAVDFVQPALFGGFSAGSAPHPAIVPVLPAVTAPALLPLARAS